MFAPNKEVSIPNMVLVFPDTGILCRGMCVLIQIRIVIMIEWCYVQVFLYIATLQIVWMHCFD